jgi:hypothetical protein
VPDARPARAASPRTEAGVAATAGDRPARPPLRQRLVQPQRFGIAAVGLFTLIAVGMLWWNSRSSPERPVETAAKSARPVAGARFSSSATTPPRVAERPAGVESAVEGTVTLAVAPWGEIFVNGDSYGRSPPLTRLSLPVGRHTIEVRNGEAESYVAQIDVTVDRAKHIRHSFQ